MKKALLVLILVGAIAAYFLFDLGQYLSLESFKARQAEIVAVKMLTRCFMWRDFSCSMSR